MWHVCFQNAAEQPDHLHRQRYIYGSELSASPVTVRQQDLQHCTRSLLHSPLPVHHVSHIHRSFLFIPLSLSFVFLFCFFSFPSLPLSLKSVSQCFLVCLKILLCHHPFFLCLLLFFMSVPPLIFQTLALPWELSTM